MQACIDDNGNLPARETLLQNWGLCKQLFLALVSWANAGLCGEASEAASGEIYTADRAEGEASSSSASPAQPGEHAAPIACD